MPNADWWAGPAPVERTRRAHVAHVWTMWKNATRRMECEITAIDGIGFEARFTGQLRTALLAGVSHARLGAARCGEEKALLAAGWLERLPTPN
jgi:hypothetical protein